MPILLKPLIFDNQFEYHIRKDDEDYIVGSKNCKFEGYNSYISGDLFLNESIEKENNLWKPKNLFHKKETIKKKGYSELYLDSVVIVFMNDVECPESSVDDFVGRIDEKILSKYQAKMDRKQIKYFFEEIHKHYSNSFLKLNS